MADELRCLSVSQVAAFRELSKKLGTLWHAVVVHSSGSPDGRGNRKIDLDFHLFVERAFQESDIAREACWESLKSDWVPERGTKRPHMWAGAARQGGDRWRFKGENCGLSALIALGPVFDSCGPERPYAGVLRFHPLKPESMTFTADHLARVRQGVSAIDSFLPLDSDSHDRGKRTLPPGPLPKLLKTRRGLQKFAETTTRDTKIVAALREGKSYRTIQRECNVGKSTVGRVAEAYGLTGHSPDAVPLEGTLAENLRTRRRTRNPGAR